MRERAGLSANEAILLLSTPCYGGQAHAAYLRGLLDLEAACARRSLPLALELSGGEALIGRGRSAMLGQFLRSPCTHLLFVDADIGFAASDVFRLLEAEKPVIGGVYAAKGAPGALELEPLPQAAADASPLHRVASVGAGFLMIRRDAAEQITQAYPALRAELRDLNVARPETAVMVFDSFVEPETGRYLSDHEAFCRRWRDIGGEVWADAGCRLTHIGQQGLVVAA
jgi:hypothetical protein